VTIIAWKTLAVYGSTHPLTMASLTHWATVAYDADWKTLAEAAGAFSDAKAIGGDRVRYEIAKGHQLIVAFDLKRGIAFVKFIGAHAEYDRVDAATVEIS